MVSTSDSIRLFWPMAMIAPMKVEAMPVRVSVPMTMPTMAQAMPTGSAFFAPSASDVDAEPQRLAPAAEECAGGDQHGDHQDQQADAAAQEGARRRGRAPPRRPARNAIGPIRAASGMPRISTTVSASPMVPAKIGV